MKKIIIALASCIYLLSFTEPKTYRVDLTLEQWQTVAAVIEKSNAPHQEVKAAQDWLTNQIVPQLQKQAKDTTTRK